MVADIEELRTDLEKAIDDDEFTQALVKYEEALKIYRALAKVNPNTFLPNVAMTLNNMSVFHLQSVPDKEKSVSLAMEVIRIAGEFQQIPIVQKYAREAIQVLQANGIDLDEWLKNESG